MAHTPTSNHYSLSQPTKLCLGPALACRGNPATYAYKRRTYTFAGCDCCLLLALNRNRGKRVPFLSCQLGQPMRIIVSGPKRGEPLDGSPGEPNQNRILTKQEKRQEPNPSHTGRKLPGPKPGEPETQRRSTKSPIGTHLEPNRKPT